MTGQTIAEKIIARHAGRERVTPGEIVWCNVDLAMVHDSTGPRRHAQNLQKLGARLWDPDRIAIITDHFVPPNDRTEAEIQKITRDFARAHGIKKFHPMEGICHIVVLENRYVLPGMLFVGADSHSTTAGVMGAFAVPVGATEMLGVWVTGQIWLRVPETIQVHWTGSLPAGVMAKDMVLKVLSQMGDDGATYQVLEYTGEGVRALPFDERIVLTNMAIEHGAKSGILAPDEVTLKLVAGAEFEPVYSDPDARYIRRVENDARQLAPLVARPHAPDNVAPAAELGDVEIDQAYLGACTGAKYHDLAVAARLLKGRKVASSVRLLVAPSSSSVLDRIAREGILSDLLASGARLLACACGACAGMGGGVLAAGERCISSTNRNYRGRMGSPEAEVFLASPATVAASALTGRITDPREFLQ